MTRWLKVSNALCLGGFAAVTAALAYLGIGWALGWVGTVGIGFGVYLERKGL
jgi:hypothetical protein